MHEAGKRDGLRASLLAGGAVATVAGLHTAIAGRRSFPGEARHGSAAVESEIRFYGIFYAAYGLRALRLAPHADRDREGVRGLAATLFAAGLARAYGWKVKGRPHPLQIALLAMELGAPLAAVMHLKRLQRQLGLTTAVDRSPEPVMAGTTLQSIAVRPEERLKPHKGLYFLPIAQG